MTVPATEAVRPFDPNTREPAAVSWHHLHTTTHHHSASRDHHISNTVQSAEYTLVSGTYPHPQRHLPAVIDS